MGGHAIIDTSSSEATEYSTSLNRNHALGDRSVTRGQPNHPTPPASSLWMQFQTRNEKRIDLADYALKAARIPTYVNNLVTPTISTAEKETADTMTRYSNVV